MDDIQDGSDLRRSKPAAHKVFGVSQTINSANYAMIAAIAETRNLGSPIALDIVLGNTAVHFSIYLVLIQDRGDTKPSYRPGLRFALDAPCCMPNASGVLGHGLEK